MATLQQLENALRKAHAAGNTEHAKRFAAEIRKMQPGTPTPEPQTDPNGLAMPLDFLNDAGARRAGQDTLGFGFGNEITAGIKSLFSDQSYDEILKGYEAEKATANPTDRLKAEVLGGAGGPGAAAMKLLNPKTWKGATALGTGLGAVEGAGMARPDERLEGAQTGGAFGAAGAVVAPLIAATPGAAKKVGGGILDMFRKTPEPPLRQAQDQAYDILSGVVKRSGKTVPEAVGDAKRLGPQATVADLLDKEGAETLAYTSRTSKGARQVADESLIPGRSADAPLRTRRDLGVGPEDADVSLATRNSLRETEKATGQQIDSFIKESGSEILPNQGPVREFLEERPDVLKAARKAMRQSRSGRDAQFEEGTNEVLVDIELEDFIRKELQSKINRGNNPMVKDSVKGARNIDAKAQWEEIVDRQLPEELTALRGQYGVDAKGVRAYDEGMKFTGMSETDVKRWLDGKTPEEISAFKAGAIEDISNKGETVGTLLGKSDQQLKLKNVFGDEEATRIKGILGREATFANTADKQTRAADAGTKAMIEGEVSQTAGKFLLGGSLRGKRAYSATGGGFMVVNEVLNQLGITNVSQTTRKELAKILVKADNIGDYVNKLEAAKLGREGQKVLDALRKKQLSVQAGAVSGILGANTQQ